MSRVGWAVALAVVVVLAAVVAAYAAGQAKTAPAGTEWEYMVVAEKEVNFEYSFSSKVMSKQPSPRPFFREASATAFDEVGAHGWELVAVVGTTGIMSRP